MYWHYEVVLRWLHRLKGECESHLVINAASLFSTAGRQSQPQVPSTSMATFRDPNHQFQQPYNNVVDEQHFDTFWGYVYSHRVLIYLQFSRAIDQKSKKKKKSKKKGNATATAADAPSTSTPTTESPHGPDDEDEGEENEDEAEGDPGSPVKAGPSEEVPSTDTTTSISNGVKQLSVGGSDDDPAARFDALVKDRDALRQEVTQLRQSLEELQAKHVSEIEAVQGELAETQTEKENAEEQYQSLLGKVNTIRSQLGERLKADAVGVFRRNTLPLTDQGDRKI